MIDYINHRLVCWSEWAIRRDTFGLGWPREAPYVREFLGHNRGGNVEEINEQAMEIESSVLALKRARPELAAVVMEFYRKTGSAAYKAKMLHICRDTMYARLHQAHVWIMGWLQDQEVLQHEQATKAKYLRIAA